MNEERYMDRALELAAFGRTSPNPMVGAVIVGPGGVVGEGFHAAAGRPHAEPEAIRRGGEASRGATMYVNLEPCAHTGRTPPCTDAIISAGIARVVIAMQDPDPAVSGRGVRALREAGIEVVEGLRRDEAAALNRAYIIHRTLGRPMVTLKSAISVDGGTAAADGSSKWITSSEARQDAHRLRAGSDAIAVGVGTVIADDPMLDVRLGGDAEGANPTPVIFDTNLRTPVTSRLARQGTIVLTCAPSESHEPLAVRGVTVLTVPGSADGVDIDSCLKILAERGILSLLVEGGPKLTGSFAGSGTFDRLVVYVAPKILGDARRMIEGWSASSIDSAPALRIIGTEPIGPDIKITLEPEGS